MAAPGELRWTAANVPVQGAERNITVSGGVTNERTGGRSLLALTAALADLISLHDLTG